MSVKPKGLLINIKIANIFHHPVLALDTNFNPYIYILYYQSHLLNPICILYIIYVFIYCSMYKVYK